MAKSKRKLKTVYPKENEGRVKDANNELRSENRSLRKKVKKLEEELRLVKRVNNKSLQYIDEALEDKKVEEVIRMVNNFDYKETQKGRNRVNKEKLNNNNGEIFCSNKCPECDKVKGEDFRVLVFQNFKMLSCKCGYRKRLGQGEGIEGS